MNGQSNNDYVTSYPDYKNFKGILTNSYKQKKDFINPLQFFIPTDAKVKSFERKVFPAVLFKTRMINLPRFSIIDQSFEKYERFEEFTKKDEVNNIALWILSALQYLSVSLELLVGKELEIIQSENPRDGRLDVVGVKENRALVIETKTDLRSVLTENRFLYQIPNYTRECVKLIMQYKKEGEVLILLGVGGEETDIFPPDHADCTTGNVGNASRIFYDKIIEKNIRFVSANALWSLVAYKFSTGKTVDLFDFLFSIFSNQNAIGLLSAGVVVKNGASLSVEPIDLGNI